MTSIITDRSYWPLPFPRFAAGSRAASWKKDLIATVIFAAVGLSLCAIALIAGYPVE